MTDNIKIDVQLHTKGAALIYPEEWVDENLPGQLNLTNEDTDQLHDLLLDAIATRKGYEVVDTRAVNVMVGDLLFGDRDFEVRDIMLGIDNTTKEGVTVIQFKTDSLFEMECPAEQAIEVWRRIQ